jgi:hypothetical protein
MQVKQNNILQFIFSGIDGVDLSGRWVSQEGLSITIQQASERLKSDYPLAKARLAYIFSNDFDAVKLTTKTCALIQDWHDGKDLFHISSVVLVVLEQFGFIEYVNGVIKLNEVAEEPFVRAMLVASVLAEVPNDLPYHNNLHFQKVLLHVIRLVAVHNNKIFMGTPCSLEHIDIAKLIIAACIHDIGHEGTGNIVDHKYHLAMIEKRSFSYAYPYLAAAGLDEEMLEDIKVMLITTDVSPLGDPISPINQLHTAFEYHFGMAEDVDDEEATLNEELSVLMENSHLCLLCVLLQEADILNSAGVHYDITRYESIAVNKEIGRSHSLPEDTLLFLQTICSSRMLSSAARFLADENLEAITRRVVEDYRSGNNPY